MQTLERRSLVVLPYHFPRSIKAVFRYRGHTGNYFFSSSMTVVDLRYIHHNDGRKAVEGIMLYARCERPRSCTVHVVKPYHTLFPIQVFLINLTSLTFLISHSSSKHHDKFQSVPPLGSYDIYAGGNLGVSLRAKKVLEVKACLDKNI